MDSFNENRIAQLEKENEDLRNKITQYEDDIASFQNIVREMKLIFANVERMSYNAQHILTP